MLSTVATMTLALFLPIRSIVCTVACAEFLRVPGIAFAPLRPSPLRVLSVRFPTGGKAFLPVRSVVPSTGRVVLQAFLFLCHFLAFFRFAQPLRAYSARCSGVRVLAVAFPPLRPSFCRYFDNSFFFTGMKTPLTCTAAEHMIITIERATQLLSAAT